MTTSRIAILAGMLGFLATPVLADPASLTLRIGGEAYDGPPKFEVLFGDKVIGEGVVDKAIDTGTDARFADAADKTPYVQDFAFEIPEDVFTPDGAVTIKFLNEAFGGVGSNRDRNLYVEAVTINGTAVPASAIATVSADGAQPNDMLGDYLVLADGTTDAKASSPEGGWSPGVMPVEAKEAVVKADAADQPVAVAEDTAKEPEAAPAAEPEVVAEAEPVAEPEVVADAEPVAEAEAPAPQDKPEEVAAVEPAAVASEPVAEAANCTPESYNVIGFKENSNDLTPELVARLDEVVTALKGQDCVVTVTGYSSTQGSYAVNALFSVERAQNVLRYLRDSGLSFTSAQATGVGETTQFGDRPSQNRRVVIAVRP